MAVIYDMPFADYYAIEAVNSSALKTVFAKSAAHAKHGVWKDTTPMRKGSALHTKVLEPRLFDSRYYTIPKLKGEGARTAVKCLKANNSDRIGIKEEDIANIETVAHAVRAHPFVGPMLESCKKEVVLTWDEEFGPCKARVDLLDKDCMGDLKSTRDCHPGSFSREIFKRDRLYWIQAALYWRGAIKNGFNIKEFYFIACELLPPYATTLHYMDILTLKECWSLVYPIAEKWAQCCKDKTYQSYPPIKNMIVMPDWMIDPEIEDEAAA